MAGVQLAPAQPAPAPACTVLGEGELYLLETPDFPLGCRVGGLFPLVAVVPLDLRVAEFKVELALFLYFYSLPKSSILKRAERQDCSGFSSVHHYCCQRGRQRGCD